MTFIKGAVGILAWAVMLVAGLTAIVTLLNGNVVTAVIAGLIAWGAWAVLRRLVESDEFTPPSPASPASRRR